MQQQQQQQQQRAVVLVSSVQRGNPVLKCLRQVAWRYADIEPDFIVGAAAAALYISVQYHLLHPTYLKSRLVSLDGKFRVRILLVHVVRRCEDSSDLILLNAPATP
jgi:DNA repair protein Rad10